MLKQLIAATAAVVGVTTSLLVFGSDVSLRSVRVDAVDVQAAADFYEAAFDLQEIGRLGAAGSGFFEIILNFGKTPEEASKNAAPPVVIRSRPENAGASPVANLIFEVADINAVIADVVKQGGTALGAPAATQIGLSYAYVLDPEGNRIQLMGE